jgi:hypothetical protein
MRTNEQKRQRKKEINDSRYIIIQISKRKKKVKNF